jgi:16S rRNA (cytosine967-C5)-methyltransferase
MGQRTGRRPASGQPAAAGQGGRRPARRADPVRRAAYDVLSAVSSRGAYANLLLAASLRERGLSGKDAALATELVYGTLRGQGSYDAVIGMCADRGLDQMDPAVRDVLRLGAHQLLGMRVKPHAAVATSVDLAVDVAGRRPAGFVNAVLRRVAAHDLDAWLAIVAPDRAADPAGSLSVRYSHPRWIVTALAEALGEDVPGIETEAALAADAERPVVTLAAVPGLATPTELVTSGSTAARWSPFGAYLPHGDPGAVAAVAQRRAGVQDEASQLAVLALARATTPADEAWLDLCAGPGGKARLLAGLAAERGAVLLAADTHEHRARLAAQAIGGIAPSEGTVSADASRPAGAATARAVTADSTAPAWRQEAFDRVLADVPCSGLGSLRRRPEVRWRRTPADIPGLAGLQRGLLVTALDSARPGGVVGYVTCSPHVAETRDVLRDVLASRQDTEVLDVPGLLPEVPDLRCPAPYERYAQFWPHRHGTDAIFMALLRKV